LTSDVIIDHCLRAIGENDPANPVYMTRVLCLSHINDVYQNQIGERLRRLATYTYNASDAAHTITSGVASLPSDFIKPSRVYDGTADDGTLLKQIRDIAVKVDDDSDMQQYLIANETTIWFFGLTPANTVNMYYYQKPTAVTDSSSSSPSALKAKFHYDAFTTYIRFIRAKELNENNTAMSLGVVFEGILDEIEYAHSAGLDDDEPRQIRDVYGSGLQ